MRLPLFLFSLLTLTGNFVSGQTANNNNSFPAASSADPAYLGSSTIATPLHKLYTGGSIKSFNTGNSGFSSPSLYLANTTASTGRTYFINSNSAGLLRFVDSNANADRLVINSSGNVGIGTSSPSTKLHVNGKLTLSDQLLITKTADNSGIPAYLSGFSTGSILDYTITGAISTANYHTAQRNLLSFAGYGQTVSAYTSAVTKSDMYISNVNASLPTGHYFLGLDNTVTVTGTSNIGNSGIAAIRTGGHIDGTATVSKFYGLIIDQINGTGTADKYGIYQVEAAARNYFSGKVTIGTTTDAGYKLDVNGSTRLNNSLVVNTDGTVALGTVTTYPSGYKLAVAGNIMAEKVRVKLQSSGWPDYVFDKKYKLPTLREIELFIQQHQHLPGVPSAAEVEKEGIDLGDNQAVLLKKIEELTLHLIELSKKVDQLSEENKVMKKQLQDK